MHRNRVERVTHTAVKQQHADRNGGYSKPVLTRSPDTHQPACPSQRDIGPAENEIDDLAPLDIYAAYPGDFLPSNPPGHESTVQDAPVVDGEHYSCRIASSG